MVKEDHIQSIGSMSWATLIFAHLHFLLGVYTILETLQRVQSRLLVGVIVQEFQECRVFNGPPGNNTGLLIEVCNASNRL